MFENGAARAATLLRRVVDGDVTALVDVKTSADTDAPRRRQTIRLAGVFVALAALLELVGGPARAGLNVITVTTVLAGLALVALLDSIRRLARGD